MCFEKQDEVLQERYGSPSVGFGHSPYLQSLYGTSGRNSGWPTDGEEEGEKGCIKPQLETLLTRRRDDAQGSMHSLQLLRAGRALSHTHARKGIRALAPSPETHGSEIADGKDAQRKARATVGFGELASRRRLVRRSRCPSAPRAPRIAVRSWAHVC